MTESLDNVSRRSFRCFVCDRGPYITCDEGSSAVLSVKEVLISRVTRGLQIYCLYCDSCPYITCDDSP